MTALYETKLREGAEGTLGTVYMRYEEVGLNEVVEINQELQSGDLAISFEESPSCCREGAFLSDRRDLQVFQPQMDCRRLPCPQ